MFAKQTLHSLSRRFNTIHRFVGNIFFVAQSHEKSIASRCFFQRNKSLAWFVKYTSCAKYACGVWNACGRGWIYFISHPSEARIFHNAEVRGIISRCEATFHPCNHLNSSALFLIPWKVKKILLPSGVDIEPLVSWLWQIEAKPCLMGGICPAK